MSFFEFPHTRTYDSDLGWIIVSMKKLITEMDEFVDFNKIKFADPITWTIDRNYEATTVVVDDQGNGYISQRPVPAGVALSDTAYWTPIFSFGYLLDTLREQIVIANEKTKTTASAIRNVNDLVWLDGLLYIVIAYMPIGTEYVEGSNVSRITVEDLLNNLQSNINNEAREREAGDLTLQSNIDNEAREREAGDLTLQTNIENAVASEASEREAADENLQEQINTIKPYAKNDIRNYGGVGDGVTDNTNAFNACMAENRSVYIPNYPNCVGYVLREIVLSSGQSVYGDSGSNIIYSGDDWLFTLASSNIEVTNLTITFTGNGNAFMMRALTNIEYVHITDIITYDCHGFYSDARSTTTYTNLYLTRITCRRQRGRGFYATKALAFLFLEHVTFDSVGIVGNWHNFHLENNAGAHLVHCEAEGGASDGTHTSHLGFYFKNCQAIWLDRCMADVLDGAGFYMDGTSNAYFYYSDCVSSLCKSHGFLLNGEYITINGGFQQGAKGQTGAISGAHGIYNFASFVTINGMIIISNTGYGFASSGGTALAISTVECRANGIYGFFISNATGIMNGCSATGNASGPISASGANFWYRDLFNGATVVTNIV